MVKLVMETWSPAAKTLVLKLISSPDVPTEVSNTATSSPSAHRIQVHVPLASAELSGVMVSAAAVPPTGASNAGSDSPSTHKRFCELTAVSGPAGCVPSYPAIEPAPV